MISNQKFSTRNATEQVNLAATLNQMTATRNDQSPTRLAGVHLPQGSELLGTIVSGAVGTGKTITFVELMEQARALGQRMIIYDFKGEFIEPFFRPGRDLLLNPVDARSESLERDSGQDMIRDWIRDESTDSCLFITSRPDVHEIIKPLLSCWLDDAINEVGCLPQSRDRRLWLFLDELASINKLPSLKTALTQLRSYGLCSVLGLQSVAQLRSIYGDADAQVILGAAQTWLALRSVDGETAAEFGAAEIAGLPDLAGYLRVPGDYPIASVQLQLKDRPVVAKAFVPRPKANHAASY